MAYVDGYYNVLRTIRQRFPKLEVETCSGGGGRVDLGVMRLTDEVWASDNTDPFDRLSIQDGFTYAYTPAVMMAWVTDSPTWVNKRTLSLEYRFLSSMQGSLGVGAGLILSFFVCRVLASSLWTLTARNYAVLPAVAVPLLLVTVLAAYVPARRASLIDPMRALRDE